MAYRIIDRSLAVVLAISLTGCNGAWKQMTKGSRTSTSGSESSNGPSPQQQEQANTKLTSDAMGAVDRLLVSRSKLLDIQDKLPATEAELQNVPEILDSLSAIATEVDLATQALEAIAKVYGTVPAEAGSGAAKLRLELLDPTGDATNDRAQNLARSAFNTATNAAAKFKVDTSDCDSVNPAVTARISVLFADGRDHCASAAPQLEPPPQNGFLNLLFLIKSVIQYLLSALIFVINSTVLSFLGGSDSAQLLFNRTGGDVLHSSKTVAIFWGPTWQNDTSDRISGIDQFFTNFGGSRNAGTANEYFDAGGNVTATSTYFGHLMDASAPPNTALTANEIVAEACKMTNNSPDPNAVYFVYTSTGAGKVDFCAWHTWGTCPNLAPILVAYEPNPDGAPCSVYDPKSGHSPGLSSLALTSAHELLETVSDPRIASWGDFKGEENADKCAWRFPPVDDGLSTLSDGSKWKLQMNWSNAAFKAGTGEPNKDGRKGCIY